MELGKLTQVLNKITFGMELETSRHPFPNNSDKTEAAEVDWAYHSDGSVSSNGGWEAVSPLMTIRSWKETHLPFIESFADKINPTDAAGLHVHVGINNMTISEEKKVQIVKLILEFWREHEDMIADRIAQRLYSRRQWCYKLDYNSFEETVDNTLRQNSLRNMASAFGDRYHTINLCSLSRHGTVEFRVWNSSKDIKYIRSAVEFSLSLVGYATAFVAKPTLFTKPFNDFEQFLDFRWAVHAHMVGEEVKAEVIQEAAASMSEVE